MATKKKKSSSSSTDVADAIDNTIAKNVKLPTFLYAAVALIAVGWIACLVWTKLWAPTVTIDTNTITAQLMKCEDLVTAKLLYTGQVSYEEGEIAFINKKAFTMQYDATVSAGVDLANAKVDVSDSVISIELPKSTLKSIEIDPDTIEIYDEQKSLFNWQNRSDTTEALKIAKEDAQKKVDESDLLTQADEEARNTVETLFSILTGENGYTLNVTTKGQKSTASTASASTGEAATSESASAETASAQATTE